MLYYNYFNIFLWRLTLKSVNLVHWREKKALLKHVLVVQHYKIWTFQKLNQGAVTTSLSYRMNPMSAHWMWILNTLMSILCQHQTVGEVTHGSDNLLLVPCTSQIVFWCIVYCVHCCVHCYSVIWMCICTAVCIVSFRGSGDETTVCVDPAKYLKLQT